MNDGSNTFSTMQLYGAIIAVVSGSYSLYLVTTGRGMTASGWLMVLLGVIVFLHGVVLLTPLAARLGTASGPLMITYAVVMLLNQARLVAAGGGVMGGGDMGGMNGGAGGMTGGMGAMGPDAGMVAIALLMLASGVIMTVRREMMPEE